MKTTLSIKDLSVMYMCVKHEIMTIENRRESYGEADSDGICMIFKETDEQYKRRLSEDTYYQDLKTAAEQLGKLKVNFEIEDIKIT